VISGTSNITHNDIRLHIQSEYPDFPNIHPMLIISPHSFWIFPITQLEKKTIKTNGMHVLKSTIDAHWFST
jgi:hypothetical protein